MRKYEVVFFDAANTLLYPYPFVGEVYAQLVRDMREGTHQTPGLDHALHNARLTDAVMRAAETGQRQKLAGQ